MLFDPAVAQATGFDDEGDSIVVTAPPTDRRALPPSLALDAAVLLERQPTTVADALVGVAGVSVRPNSRGEAVARIRGAEERQTQIFLDGAPLAVPWDGRVDLGYLPAGLIGGVRVMKGAVPIEYGPNTVAGAIDLQLPTTDQGALHGIVRAGTFGEGELAVVGGGSASGGVTAIFGLAAVSRNAERVADAMALPFSQDDPHRRTNTDLESRSLFGAVSLKRGAMVARLSLLNVDASRGIAPESDRDPVATVPRYWRYPDIGLTQVALASLVPLGGRSELRLNGWTQWFDQQIVQYSDASYAVARTRQRDRDLTHGGRLTVAHSVERVDFRLSMTAQTSRHLQSDTPLPSATAVANLGYRQTLFTAGLEADIPVRTARVTLGIGYDRAATPRTGDKPPQQAIEALALSAAARGDLGRDAAFVLSAGRRTRFPTARELFGEALGRFLINPDLKPETAWLIDAELIWRRPRFEATINPFFSRVENNIGQRVVRVGTRSLRQRYNLSGATTYGIDANARSSLGASVDAELFGTVLSARADGGDAPFRRLPQRPRYEFGGALDVRPSTALSMRAEARRVGPAVDLDALGGRLVLPAGSEINLRARYIVATAAARRFSLTAALDNIANGVITPQAGLPLPGRSARIGLIVD